MADDEFIVIDEVEEKPEIIDIPSDR